MSGFTPGPWVARFDPPNKFSTIDDAGGWRIDAGDIEQIAYVWNDTTRLTVDGSKGPAFGSRNGAADARLIAAAPDLYEACRLLIEQYDSGPDFTMGGNLTNAPFTLARAAIAKATGAKP